MKFRYELSLSIGSGSLFSLESALLSLGLRKDWGLHQTAPSHSLLVFSCHPSEEVLDTRVIVASQGPDSRSSPEGTTAMSAGLRRTLLCPRLTGTRGWAVTSAGLGYVRLLGVHCWLVSWHCLLRFCVIIPFLGGPGKGYFRAECQWDLAPLTRSCLQLWEVLQCKRRGTWAFSPTNPLQFHVHEPFLVLTGI